MWPQREAKSVSATFASTLLTGRSVLTHFCPVELRLDVPPDLSKRQFKDSTATDCHFKSISIQHGRHQCLMVAWRTRARYKSKQQILSVSYSAELDPNSVWIHSEARLNAKLTSWRALWRSLLSFWKDVAILSDWSLWRAFVIFGRLRRNLGWTWAAVCHGWGCCARTATSPGDTKEEKKVSTKIYLLKHAARTPKTGDFSQVSRSKWNSWLGKSENSHAKSIMEGSMCKNLNASWQDRQRSRVHCLVSGLAGG